MSTPFVSCVCLTYNRPSSDGLHLVEEAVESYLRQDYPFERRQLILLNDTPGQRLSVGGWSAKGRDPQPYEETPGIRVFNNPWRLRSLGEKYLAAMALAQGEIVMWWDDDDISLPWRISHSVKCLSRYDYYNPGGYWFSDANGLHHAHGTGPCWNCSAWTREAYEKGAAISFGMDLDMRLHDNFVGTPGIRAAPKARGPDEWSYIYRWGVSSEHVSGWGMGTKGGQPASPGYHERGKREIKRGDFVVRPRWREDYVCAVYAYLERLASERKMAAHT
jgi:glycosyltransferase involved in cell wall biosynthesis